MPQSVHFVASHAAHVAPYVVLHAEHTRLVASPHFVSSNWPTPHVVQSARGRQVQLCIAVHFVINLRAASESLSGLAQPGQSTQTAGLPNTLPAQIPFEPMYWPAPQVTQEVALQAVHCGPYTVQSTHTRLLLVLQSNFMYWPAVHEVHSVVAKSLDKPHNGSEAHFKFYQERKLSEPAYRM